MKHFKYKLLFLLIISLSGSGCKKNFLEVNDNNQLTRQSQVVDLNSMENFVRGLYTIMSRRGGFDDGITIAYADLVGDNLKPRDFPGIILQYKWAQQKDDLTGINTSALNMNGAWKLGYQLIRACSFVIEDCDKYRGENPEKADNLKGQAYAIRAYAHFRIATIFAQSYGYSADASHQGIPYIATSDITKKYSRQSVSEVYSSIVSDLNTALNLLPPTVTDIRFMNRNAAKALLARVSLFKGDYLTAATLAKEVALVIPLMSIEQGYPNGLFMNKQPNATEVLFQETPSNEIFNFFTGTYLRGQNLSYDATSDIARLLKESFNDARSQWVTDNLGIWSVTKFPIKVTGTPALNSTPESDYYQPVIRSSEMFLTAAEAFAKLGDENNARFYINTLRKRASPDFIESNAAGAELMALIQIERRKELCFEGFRLFDIQRWKQDINRIDVSDGAPKILRYPNDKAISPIPIQDVNMMGINQNLGY
jgi:starch-binding outer membrane protein, SusD/RagB family